MSLLCCSAPRDSRAYSSRSEEGQLRVGGYTDPVCEICRLSELDCIPLAVWTGRNKCGRLPRWSVPTGAKLTVVSQRKMTTGVRGGAARKQQNGSIPGRLKDSD